MGLSSWLRTVLRKLFAGFRKQHSPTSQSGGGRSAAPKPYTILTRFIFDTTHFRKKEPARAKPGAFLPQLNLKTSALGRDGKTEDDVWAIGILVGQERSKTPKARADFDAGAVAEVKLTIEHNPVDRIPDHVNLCGWPKGKDEQKSIAQLLCVRSKLVLHPDEAQAAR